MSREVLQQALEVLKGCLEHPDAQDSIIAIEHELAQPEHPEQMARLGWQYVECPACGSEGARAFPKPEQEPVVTKNEKGLTLHVGWDDLPAGTRLYTSPPQRQPLRGEQIYEIFVKTLPKLTLGMTYVPEWAIPIARAIEAKHGIGDKT